MQHIKLAVRQHHRLTCEQHHPGHWVQGHWPRCQHGLRLTRAATHQGVQTRSEFQQINGFDHVVISTQIQTLHTVWQGIPGRENEHRGVDTGLANVMQHLHAVLTRKPQVEDRSLVQL